MENREGRNYLSPSKGRVMKKKWQEKREGHKKISHFDSEGMLQCYVVRKYNIQKSRHAIIS